MIDAGIELKAVEAKIEALINKQTKLKEKDAEDGLSDKEHATLEGIAALLAQLNVQQKNYFELVKIAAKDDATPAEMSFRNADSDWINKVTGVNTKRRDWAPSITDDLKDPVNPSDIFKGEFEKIFNLCQLTNEAGRRFFLNLFLLDILARKEFDNELRLFPRISMSVTETCGNKKRKLAGKTDYTVGFGKHYDSFDKGHPQELHLVAIEAKLRVGDDFWQCVAEAATLWKSRKDAGKEKCSVWGVLTDASHWLFIYIDEDGWLWRGSQSTLTRIAKS